MFRKAYDMARHFTAPVISYHTTVSGLSDAGLGSLIVVNDDGWIVTAAHIVQQAAALAGADNDARTWEIEREKIRSDGTISSKERSNRYAAIGKRNNKSVRRAGTVWGHHSSKLVDISVRAEVDLAVWRLDPFDPSWVSQYPIFKDPSKSLI